MLFPLLGPAFNSLSGHAFMILQTVRKEVYGLVYYKAGKAFSMDIKLLIQKHTNPNALSFVLNIPVKTEGKVTYKSVLECSQNPMAQALFTIPNVSEVYMFDNYVTVTQDGNVEWDAIRIRSKISSWNMPRP